MKTTHYLLILDRSGSMSSCWTSTMSALNEQILSIQNTQSRNQNVPIKANLITFSNEVNFEFLNVPAAHLEPISGERIFPNGGTAMLDGIGQGIARIEHIMEDGDDVVCVILTDGEENASSEFTYEKVGKKIEELKATEKWSFIIMGADFDILSMASKLKIDSDKQFTFSKEKTSEVFQEMSLKMDNYIVAKSTGTFKDVFKFDKEGKRKKQND